MSKVKEKIEAINLRKKGLSISDIAFLLNVSKSSISMWCRDLELTEKQKDRLKKKSIKAGSIGRLLGSQANKEKKIFRVKFYKKQGKNYLGELSKRDVILVAAALYWGEGSKTGGRFIFINSDPDMIKFMFNFLINDLSIGKDKIKLNIQINETHKYRIKEILKFWSFLLKFPIGSFGNTYFIKTKTKKFYPNHKDYYGIIRLSVSKSSELQYKILGLISSLKE